MLPNRFNDLRIRKAETATRGGRDALSPLRTVFGRQGREQRNLTGRNEDTKDEQRLSRVPLPADGAGRARAKRGLGVRERAGHKHHLRPVVLVPGPLTHALGRPPAGRDQRRQPVSRTA
jgi:hypothetical protein